jgi:hypothetical protein
MSDVPDVTGQKMAVGVNRELLNRIYGLNDLNGAKRLSGLNDLNRFR